MTPRLFEKAEQPFEIPRPFGKEKNIYSYFGRKNSSYYPTTKVPERRLHEIYDPAERTSRIPLGMGGLQMEWTDTGLVLRSKQSVEKPYLLSDLHLDTIIGNPSGPELEEEPSSEGERAASFYGNLGKIRSDRYADPVVKVGSIETARRFPGSQNFYNGKPGIVLEVKHGWEHFVFSLIGHAYAGRFLDEFKVDTEKGLVGKVVEILGEGGKGVQPEFGEPSRLLVPAYGIRPVKRFM